MDIDDTYGHKTNAEMYEYIKANLDFDQMIWEFGTDENPAGYMFLTCLKILIETGV